MTHADREAANTAKIQGNVVPAKGTGAAFANGRLAASLPPYSYQMIRLKA